MSKLLSKGFIGKLFRPLQRVIISGRLNLPDNLFLICIRLACFRWANPLFFTLMLWDLVRCSTPSCGVSLGSLVLASSDPALPWLSTCSWGFTGPNAYGLSLASAGWECFLVGLLSGTIRPVPLPISYYTSLYNT